MMMTRKIPIAFAIALLLTVAAPLHAATPKAGAKCTKAGATATAGGKKFTCVKSGTRLVWNKGVAIKAATKPSLNPVLKPVPPTPTPTNTPKNRAGDPCTRVGDRQNNSDGYLECREVANKAKKFFQLSIAPKAPATYISPESLDVCRIPDQSTTDRSEGPSIAYPIPSGKLFASIPRVGPINALIIPIDFPDSPGSGSPRDMYNDIIEKSNEWMKWSKPTTSG
jgi:hypothetical protein